MTLFVDEYSIVLSSMYDYENEINKNLNNVIERFKRTQTNN